MLGLAQDVKGVRVHKLRELVEFSVVVDAQRGAVRPELNQDVEVLSLSELLLCLVIHVGIKAPTDASVEDVGPRIVVGAHGKPLSSSRRSAYVFPQEKHCSTPGRRVSKMRFHDTILPPLK